MKQVIYLEKGSRAVAPEESCPHPNPKTNPSPNPNPNQGPIFLGPIVRIP